MMHVTVFTHIGIAVNEDDKGDTNQLGTNDLQDVFSQLVEATKDWFDMGLALGIKVDILEGIKSNENYDKARLREMLTHWLRSSPSRTWSDICNGLRSDTVQQGNLADKIEEKYKGTIIQTCLYNFIFSRLKTEHMCIDAHIVSQEILWVTLTKRFQKYSLHYMN